MNVILLKPNEYVYCQSKDQFKRLLALFRSYGILWQNGNKITDEDFDKYDVNDGDYGISLDKDMRLAYHTREQLDNLGYIAYSFIEMFEPLGHTRRIINDQYVLCFTKNDFIKVVKEFYEQGFLWQAVGFDDPWNTRAWEIHKDETVLSLEKGYIVYGRLEGHPCNTIYTIEEFLGQKSKTIKLQPKEAIHCQTIGQYIITINELKKQGKSFFSTPHDDPCNLATWDLYGDRTVITANNINRIEFSTVEAIEGAGFTIYNICEFLGKNIPSLLKDEDGTPYMDYEVMN